MKLLSLRGLQTLVSELKNFSVPTEYNYYLPIKNNATYEIPNYTVGKSLIEVYINGLKVVPNRHYTVSNDGRLTLIYQYDSDNSIHIIHKKYE